jgi:hypothetical protein
VKYSVGPIPADDGPCADLSETKMHGR